MMIPLTSQEQDIKGCWCLSCGFISWLNEPKKNIYKGKTAAQLYRLCCAENEWANQASCSTKTAMQQLCRQGTSSSAEATDVCSPHGIRAHILTCPTRLLPHTLPGSYIANQLIKNQENLTDHTAQYMKRRWWISGLWTWTKHQIRWKSHVQHKHNHGQKLNSKNKFWTLEVQVTW